MEQTLFQLVNEAVEAACQILDMGCGTNMFTGIFATLGGTGLTGLVLWGMLFD